MATRLWEIEMLKQFYINTIIYTLFCLKLLLIIICIPVISLASEYPEYTGNYYKCSEGWCEIKHQQLNTMLLFENKNVVAYGGFINIPDTAPTIKQNKPNFLFYIGKNTADPRYTAIVKLEQYDYNDAPIHNFGNKDYKGKIKYNEQYIKQRLWIFKKEIPFRVKPIEGKTGMYIIEPTEILEDGFYAIDYGTPEKGGHTGLKTAPSFMGFYKASNIVTAIPFVIGDRTILKKSTNSTKSNMQESENSLEATVPQKDNANKDQPATDVANKNASDKRKSNNTGKALNGLIKNIFRDK
ncbi:MAG: hypothetical protein WCG87_13345 [Bacteroidota bacterium]